MYNFAVKYMYYNTIPYYDIFLMGETKIITQSPFLFDINYANKMDRVYDLTSISDQELLSKKVTELMLRHKFGQDLSYLTAITRKTLTAPTKYLFNKNLLIGNILDYGCGKSIDSEILENCDKFDPYYYNDKKVFNRLYNTIICNYVLNVVHKDLEQSIIQKIKSLLKQNGKAYISVRRDVKIDGFTKKGTYQRNVILNYPIIKENKSFCIYELCKE